MQHQFGSWLRVDSFPGFRSLKNQWGFNKVRELTIKGSRGARVLETIHVANLRRS